MRALYYLPLCAALIGCESDVSIAPVTLQWMEWPAEVLAARPFPVRLIVIPVAVCQRRVFRAGISADQSAVTVAPYYLVEGGPTVCPPVMGGGGPFLPEPFFVLDTMTTAPGLSTTYARTFDIRGAADVSAAGAPVANDLPQRTFGAVTVRLSNPDTTRRNAAGVAILVRDTLGCALVQPFGFYIPDAAYMLEDQKDTAGVNYAFVRGYLHDAPAPVCGRTRVFHVVSRN
jgi:hypothetical protein